MEDYYDDEYLYDDESDEEGARDFLMDEDDMGDFDSLMYDEEEDMRYDEYYVSGEDYDHPEYDSEDIEDISEDKSEDGISEEDSDGDVQEQTKQEESEETESDKEKPKPKKRKKTKKSKGKISLVKKVISGAKEFTSIKKPAITIIAKSGKIARSLKNPKKTRRRTTTKGKGKLKVRYTNSIIAGGEIIESEPIPKKHQKNLIGWLRKYPKIGEVNPDKPTIGNYVHIIYNSKYTEHDPAGAYEKTKLSKAWREIINRALFLVSGRENKTIAIETELKSVKVESATISKKKPKIVIDDENNDDETEDEISESEEEQIQKNTGEDVEMLRGETKQMYEIRLAFIFEIRRKLPKDLLSDNWDVTLSKYFMEKVRTGCVYPREIEDKIKLVIK